MKIDWEDDNLGGTVTTKAELLQQLEFTAEDGVDHAQVSIDTMLRWYEKQLTNYRVHYFH